MRVARVHERPWLTITAAALTYDAWLIRNRRDSLSRRFAAAAQRRPLLHTFTVAYVLAHLYGALPKRADAFLTVAERLG